MQTFIYSSLNSTQDEALKLAKEDRLPEWGSVLALTQNSGRGQLRKHWESIEGNLMASVRLPYDALFSSQAGAVVTGTLIASSLIEMDFPVKLKWPNDLIILLGKKPFKVGGILLEERGKIIIAGVGINLAHSPEISSSFYKSVFPPANLAQTEKHIERPQKFWEILLSLMISIYTSPDFPTTWHWKTNALLIGKGKGIILDTGITKIHGTLEGINESGELLVQTGGKVMPCVNGELSFD